MSKLATVLVILVLFSFDARAATFSPIISGGYALAQREFCPATLVDSFGNSSTIGQYMMSMDLTADNTDSIKYEIGNAYFNTASQTASFSSTRIHGSAVSVQASGGLEGEPLTQDTRSGSATYSNTASSLTLGSQTFTAVYAQIDRIGVAHYIAFLGFDSSQPGCMTQGELIGIQASSSSFGTGMR